MRIIQILALLAGFACCCGPVSAQEADPRIREIFDRWAKQRAKFDVIEYRISGTATTPAGVFTTDDIGKLLPPEQHRPKVDETGKIEIRLLLDLGKNRFRREASFPLHGGEDYSMSIRKTLQTFDGTQLWNWLHPERADPKQRGRSDVIVSTGNLRGAMFTYSDWPMFIGLGIVPTDFEPILPNRFQPEVKPESFFVHGTGVIDGRNCTVIRTVPDNLPTPSYLEYWVDPQQAGLVRRIVGVVDRKVTSQHDVEYSKHDTGVWLPRRWTFTQYGATKPRRIERLNVDFIQLQGDLQDADFVVALQPGMTLSKKHLPGDDRSIIRPSRSISKGTFIVSEDGRIQPTSDATTNAVTMLQRWVGLVLLLLVLVIGTGVYYRVSQRRAA